MDENILDGMSRIVAVNIVGLSRYRRIKIFYKIEKRQVWQTIENRRFNWLQRSAQIVRNDKYTNYKNMYLAGRTPLTFLKNIYINVL